MKAVPAWVYYSAYRVLMFAVPLAILLLLRIEWWLATLLAATIGLCLSYIFLRKPRETVASDLYRARHRDKKPVRPDDESEDAALDRAAFDRAEPNRSAPNRSEREGETEQHSVREGRETGELEGKNQLP